MAISTAGLRADQAILPGDNHRLWSLWDMKDFYAPGFFEVCHAIGRITEKIASLKQDAFRDEKHRKNDVSAFKAYAAVFSEIGFSMCASHTMRIIEKCKAPILLRDFSVLIRELYNRMEDEAKDRVFISLSKDEERFYAPITPLFGKEVEDKLPGVIEDIAESGKCLGLGRGTASVFHLMRVMEVGVQKFGDKLGVTLTDEKVWQVILDGINAEIKKLGKTPEAKIYASISAHLYSVKLAWRNEAMHPKATYTPEEAQGIFNAVRLFMQELVGVL